MYTNRETGNGYCDVLISVDRNREAILIETKFAERGRLEEACKRAVNQIRQKRYVESLYKMGFNRIVAYGIAFYCKTQQLCFLGNNEVVKVHGGIQLREQINLTLQTVIKFPFSMTQRSFDHFSLKYTIL